jgi:hypothetical protein
MCGIMRRLVSLKRIERSEEHKTNAMSGVGKTMDASIEELKEGLDSKWALMGLKKGVTAERLLEMVDKKTFRNSRMDLK